MREILIVDAQKCTGCRMCEIYCSFSKTKTCNPARSRVSVVKWEEQGINVPSMCQHCEDPPCVPVCPTGAISKDSETDAVLTNEDLCIGCKMCLIACPFGAPSIDPVESKVIRCDLCEGDPVCAKVCPTGAIKWINADRAGLMRKREGMEKLTSLTKLALVTATGGD